MSVLMYMFGADMWTVSVPTHPKVKSHIEMEVKEVLIRAFRCIRVAHKSMLRYLIPEIDWFISAIYSNVEL